jgi:hypothetical protein
MNHLLAKTVQLDIRTSRQPWTGEKPVKKDKRPVKLVSNPDQLTEEERKKESAKAEEVRG